METSRTTDSDAATDGCPDVCSLPADEQRERSSMIRREILSQVTRREELEDGVVLEFERTPAMERKLADLVAFERQCCGGLDWQWQPVSPHALRLCVRGLPPGFDLFEPGGSQRRRPRKRGTSRQ